MESKADLHVHTKYSDRPSEWFLRRVGAPESFTEPIDVYRRCKARGMDYVTISDHNCINGALDIAHLPGTFISSEITTYFPEDGCKIHCLVTAVDEAQFRMIDELRTNIYEFQRYLIENDIIYSVAHPLFSVNHRLTPDHVEKLLLLFNRFEGINGARHPRASQIVNAIFRNLTPKMIEDMSDRQGLEPLGETPWIKSFTGGSDDHGGVYIANAYTTTPKAERLEEFLTFLRDGNHEMGGEHGTSLRLAHSFYHIAMQFYRQRVFGGAKGSSMTGQLLERLLDPPNAEAAPTGFRGKTRAFLTKRAMKQRKKVMSPAEQMLVTEFQKLLRAQQGPGFQQAGEPAHEDRTFKFASRISQQLGFAFCTSLIEHLKDGDLLNSLQTFASLGPVALGVTPYIAAMGTQHKDEHMLQWMGRYFEQAHHLKIRGERRAWITDTFSDVSGVTRTIRSVARIAKQRGAPLTVISCAAGATGDDGIAHKNFEPLGECGLPEYETQKVAFPPFLEVIEYLEREGFSELIISTPGPMGLVALAAAKLLGLKTTGIYHTDFPEYVGRLADDHQMASMTERLMQWFYDQMDEVLVPSDAYRTTLLNYGIADAKISVMRRGVDAGMFHTGRRDERYWANHGLGDRFTFVYAGRVSQEKNLDLLLDSFNDVLGRGLDVQLAMIGDGPARKELESKHGGDRVRFTGFMAGEAFATALAGSDVFVFPSTTDTFGNAVLEAMACGLPAIVSNQGGPQEIVAQHGGGMVVDVEDDRALADMMELLFHSASLRDRLCEAAQKTAASATWESIFDKLWDRALDLPADKSPVPQRPREAAERVAAGA